MKALITGASSGMGLEFAKILSQEGHETFLVALDEDGLKKAQEMLPNKSTTMAKDLSKDADLKSVCELIKKERIDILINNAGFADYNEFHKADLDRDLNMINVNVRAVHVLAKYALQEMVKRDKGFILNVASSAGLMPGGPMLATYYATKAYVRSLSESINHEMRMKNRNVVVSVLCPGPVDTNFNKTGKVQFSIKQMTPDRVAKYAIKQMMEKRKMLIIPGVKMKLAKFATRFLSDKTVIKMTRGIQSRGK